ncbi:MAG: RNA-binding transcriptional accessory protein [Anaerolineae bacterium]|nr:RNA-binding transcriptional accessory protein [Anaerolineae bacterium]
MGEGMQPERLISEQLRLGTEKVQAAIRLLDEGHTVPFLARYRKEATGGLDEDQIRQVAAALERLRALEERRRSVVASIEGQGKLTPALRRRLASAQTLTELEDLYQPYRPKRRTRASIARERGLQPLADLILKQARPKGDVTALAAPFVSEEVTTPEDAWAGARDIVAEMVSDDPEVRGALREKAARWGLVGAKKLVGSEDPRRVYELYYEFEARADRLRPHQVLALNRGEAEKVLRVRLDVAERDWRSVVEARYRPDPRSPLAAELEAAVTDGVQRLLLPAIERDVRRQLTEAAEDHAISVFASNLRSLLSQPPLSGHTVLGLDPGYRTGCKVAVVDPTGKVLETATIYPHPPQRQRERALADLARLIPRHGVTLVAIGNGTASRETEQLVAALTQALDGVRYLLVNEAGASVYSASPQAREELPDLDVSLRGAVSIARRVQDPLAELVKIDPRSIGVGMYQHDVDQKRLAAALTAVVESVVNQVGVDVNTASASLLTYVAGIGPKLAQSLVAYRDAHGPFRDRRELLKVPGLGPKAFQQAAGFLRIRGGRNPLDASAIHPESYPVAEAVLAKAGVGAKAPMAKREAGIKALLARQPVAELARELGAGVLTLTDILEQLVRPGRDPREDLPAPILRSDVLSMDDLRPGMRLQGTVRNVVDFGAFVDIGVKQDGLLHRSQIPPGASPGVGDVIGVAVLEVDQDRGRISLGWIGQAD